MSWSSKQDRYDEAREVFKDIAPKNLDWPEAIWEAWLSFEHSHGSLNELEDCMDRVKRAQAQVHLKRTKVRWCAQFRCLPNLIMPPRRLRTLHTRRPLTSCISRDHRPNPLPLFIPRMLAWSKSIKSSRKLFPQATMSRTHLLPEANARPKRSLPRVQRRQRLVCCHIGWHVTHVKVIVRSAFCSS
jgi:hypothetical protein